jgi:hypothetical protein
MKIKAFKIRIKEQYFSKKSQFLKKTKHLYKTIKSALGKKTDDNV